MNAPVLVYGSREFGKVVRALVEDCGRRFGGYIDDWDEGPGIVGRLDAARVRFPPGACEIALAVGYKHIPARWALYLRLSELGYTLPALVHPAAYVSRRARVGDGAMVMARATVDGGATIGRLSVLWPGAIVNHDAEVGDNCFVSPGAVVCGSSRVGAGSFVGAGAVVVDHRCVPAGARIKAGSLVKGESGEGGQSDVGGR